MKSLFTSEIFKGIQGEGFHSGNTAVFVRFAGCNLKCTFCDTKYARKMANSVEWFSEDLAKVVIKELGKCKFVVLTGGEPMMQHGWALKLFIDELKDNGVYVAIETNGTLKFDKEDFYIDWVTVSPKNDFFMQHGDELKVLVSGEFKEEDLKMYEKCKFKYFYLQPILPEYFNGNSDLQFIRDKYTQVEGLILDNPKWKMSFQLHKLMGWR
jgi:organic radical activating enzyme